MKKISYLAIVVIAFIATSCLGSSDSNVELTRTLTGTHNFSVVQRLTDNGQYMVDLGADYKVEILMNEEKTLSLSVSNLQYWGDQPRTSFRLKDIPFSYDVNNGAVVVDLPTVESDGVKITDLHLAYLERTDGEISLPAWDIVYTVNDTYRVRVVQDIVALFGEAKVDDYTTEAPYYQLFFDPMKLKDGSKVDGHFIIYGAKFAENMPPMNVKFYFTADFNGSSFSINSTSPVELYTIDGNQEIVQPEYEITNLSCNGTIDLTGSNKYPYNFDFTVGGRWSVSLVLGYSIPVSWMLPDAVQ